MIRLLEPIWLLALLPVLALAAAYVWRQLRRRHYALRFTNVELLRSLAPKGIGARRHLSAGALLVAMAILATGMAKPSVDRKVPLERATVMLAIDVSLSMQSTDVPPSRIDAAKQAAIDFVRQLPASFNVGLVSFAKSANVLVSPGKERAAVQNEIQTLQLAQSTATGEAVFTSLEAIRGVPADGAQGPPPARVVLLSDGYRTFGRTVAEAAAAASAANVPVSTIAFGTDAGTVSIEGEIQRVPVDRPSLQQLAEITKGHFYEAATLSELKKVYQDMGSSIGYRTQPREVTQWYLGIGLLCALVAAGMSLLWSSRLP
jgi:Ca-activated chloride channel family protein